MSPSHAVDVRLPDSSRIQVEFSAENLQAAASPFLERLWQPLERLADEYKVQYAERGDGRAHEGATQSQDRFAPPPRRLSQLVLVGGSTKAPLVSGFAERIAGLQGCSGVDPEVCVALGAAVHAGLMEGSVAGGLEMTDSVYVKDMQDRLSGFQM